MASINSKLFIIFCQYRHLLIVFLFIMFLFYNTSTSPEEDILKKMPPDALKFVLFPTQKPNKLDISHLKELVKKRNALQHVWNLEFFGPVDTDTVILVILVGKYSKSLKYLIASLSQVSGVEDTLLIFSHSLLDENVDNIIRTIRFARVLQIYYPYSMQLFPREFPGFNPNDCPYYMGMKRAIVNNCTGASTPDLHGRYRHPVLAEEKHHWWWTANTIFENLTCSGNHKGHIMFLQDNYYILDDFVYMVSRMKKICSAFSTCQFLSLGTYSFSKLDSSMAYVVQLQTWNPEYHSSVFGFDSGVWNDIVSHFDLFCSIDDSSWSRSLFYVSSSRNDGNEFKVLSSELPRAFPTSHKNWETWFEFDMAENVLHILNLRGLIQQEFFPPFIETYVNLDLENEDYVLYDFGKSSGGWNDPRDKMLCVNMTKSLRNT